MSPRRRTALLVVVALLTAGAAFALVTQFDGRPGITDTPVYRTYGDRIVRGDVPYRDFTVEYPPGALVPFVLPAIFSSNQSEFNTAFRALMGLTLAAIVLLLVLSLQALGASTLRVAGSVLAFLAGIAILGPFVLTRFDLYAAAVTLAAACAILRRRERLGAVLLGVAIATKIYPAVLLPLFLIRLWRKDGSAAALRALALTVGAAFLVYLPFLFVAPEGVLRSIWRQLGRPLQIESLGSAALLALHNAAGMPLAWASGSGSQNLTGTVAGVASAITTILGIAALLLVWVRYSRGDTDGVARFAQYAAAATVAFVAFGKVLSPQFLVWLLAAVVLVQGRRGILSVVLLLIACGLTRLWFPSHFWTLVFDFNSTAATLVLLRDLVLVNLFGVLILRIRAREPGPG